MSIRPSGYLFGIAGVAACVLSLLPLRNSINTTPIALAFLLVILLTAALFGTGAAIMASLVSGLCLNYYFLPPYGTLTIADPENWVALAAFFLTALIAGSLSGRAKRRAEEAEKRQKEIEDLYAQLKEMFAKAGQVEAMKQSEQLKSALLDAVTHDLRTPLTSMKAAATTLLAGAGNSQSGMVLDDEARHELLEVINNEIDRLNHHLEGLIEIAKIEAGAMQPRRTWTNMEEIVSISLTRAASIVAHHTVKRQLEEGLPPVRVDEKSISEVLYLVLENAAKYAPVHSEIALNVQKTPDNTLKVSIQDQGIGIPRELREKVFDKFFRFSETEMPAHPSGLGMGLAIARALVEAHGGHIWIEDPAGGRGTRVSFTIPIMEPEK
jgi:two-component system sensor histidine kinase KdpD